MSHDAHNPTSGAPAESSQDPRELLDAYLDGMLEGEELASFERALADNPALKADVEAQRAINGSLSRLFQRAEPIALRNGAAGAGGVMGAALPAATIAPPSLKLAGGEAGGTSAVEAATKGGSFLMRPMSPWMAVAAAIFVVGLAALYVTGVIDPDKLFGPRQVLVSPDVVYKRKVQAGYNPDWVCENDEQFVQNTRDMFNEPLLVPNTDSVKVVGWSYYEPVFSAGTAIVLTMVDGKEVIVVMDRKEKDRTIKLPASSGLHVFHKVIGNAVLYEVGPFDTARVLPLVQRK